MPQAGGDVYVASHKGPQFQSLGPSGYNFGHLHGIHAAGELVGDKDDGLGGVVKHGLHLVAIADHGVYVRWEKHGHDKVDVGQGVTHRDALDDVLQHRYPSFSGAMVDDVEAV